jgi:thiol-disulfide isomerase/thioredoxin
MPSAIKTILLILAVSLPGGQIRAAEAGNKAPVIDVTWIKNGPVKLDIPKDIKHELYYIVDFWATWSKTSVELFPYLNYIQDKYRSKGVTVIAISAEKEPIVRQFIDKQDSVLFAVAADNEGRTSTIYMDPEKIIPTAFIFDKKKRILWKGAPSDLEETLIKIFEGRLDIQNEKMIAALKRDFQSAMQQGSLPSALEKAKKILDYDRRSSFAIKGAMLVFEQKNAPGEAMVFIDELITKEPGYSNLYFLKLELMARNGAPESELDAWSKTTAAKFQSDSIALNNLAWMLLNTPQFGTVPLRTAFNAAKKAVDNLKPGDDPVIMSSARETLARAYYAAGIIDKAAETQSKAAEMVKGRPEYNKSAPLAEYYKKALALQKDIAAGVSEKPAPAQKPAEPAPAKSK